MLEEVVIFSDGGTHSGATPSSQSVAIRVLVLVGSRSCPTAAPAAVDYCWRRCSILLAAAAEGISQCECGKSFRSPSPVPPRLNLMDPSDLISAPLNRGSLRVG